MHSYREIRRAVVVVPVLAAFLLVVWSFDRSLDRARDQAQAGALVLSQYVERLIDTQRLLHGAAMAKSVGDPGDFVRSEEFHRFLADVENTQHSMNGVAVFDAEGTALATSRSPQPSLRTPGQPYILAITRGENFFADRVAVQPGGMDSLVFASPFITADLSGVIVSAIDTAAVVGNMRSVAAGPGASASILRNADRMLLARTAAPGGALQLAADAPAAAALAEGGDNGIYSARAISDGLWRVYAFRTIPGSGLSVHFGWSYRTLLMETLRMIWLPLLLLGVATGGALAYARQAERSIRLQNESESRSRMVHEMNHRVKNNLAMIIALVSSKKRQKAPLDYDDLIAKLMAIAEVHDLMYNSEEAGPVDFGLILRRLCSSAAVIPEERGITAVLDLQDGLLLEPRVATSLVLAAAELITNAVKHAFAGRDGGTIRICLARRSDGWIVLEVRDDGPGLPEGGTRRHSGLRLVEAFTAQVGGQVRTRSDGGAVFEISFPDDILVGTPEAAGV